MIPSANTEDLASRGTGTRLRTYPGARFHVCLSGCDILMPKAELWRGFFPIFCAMPDATGRHL